jgi:HAD superfamily hydrolase (TIGR01509 family)
MGSQVRAVFFDLGGVYYTEGFREGLFAIARKYGFGERSFFETASQVIFADGYVRGEAPERMFWDELALAAGLDIDLYPDRSLILEAFKPIPGMEALVARTGEEVPVGLLTDQCNWLYELDDRDGLFTPFQAIISSYEEGFTKRNPEIFRIACQRMDALPQEVLFFDDNTGNVNNARDFGIRAFLFENAPQAEGILVREGVLK